jgi:hypothetical protein
MSVKREDLLKQMKDSIGTKEPIEFFGSMVDIFGLLFDRIDQLETDINRLKTYSALAIQWEPQIANDMLTRQIDILRQDKDTYFTELTALKVAYAEGIVTKQYDTFCTFWIDTLGYHPFLDYKK